MENECNHEHQAQKQRRGRGLSPAKTAETQTRIVKAAFQLFISGGFEGTRMIDVAQQAGLGKGTLYRYYPTKEALFEGVLVQALGSTVQTLQNPNLEPTGSIEEILRQAIRPFMADLQKSHKADLLRLIITEGPRFPSLVAVYQRVVLEPVLSAIQTLAKQAKARGEIKSEALIEYPMLMLSPGLLSIIWNGLFLDRQLQPEALFDAFIELIFVQS
ncbi:MAG: TetR/AcrR family transcriptional regulator [Thiofilum sp.]|uniref:TetR/AcrR family transcriptional regulator n=1 Tax=Thiofilum sp. TaxID=2212733 RepID=UPI0025CCF22F|nr:TetR/AcrR family transcriptional regulator [Thiofilum sp.]MBK8453694.1 TetR/AcrR family transcriptional regulator [Thiofilum sp.]